VKLSRRKFLQLAALGAGYELLPKNIPGLWKQSNVDLIDYWKKTYANGTRLGRVLATLPLRTRPNEDAAQVGTKYQDNIVTILREVIGKGPASSPHNHRWFETTDGYLWAPHVFPQEFQIQTPLESIPDGKVWVEVSVPWVEGHVAPDANSPVYLLQPGDRPATLYNAAIFPAKKVVKDDQGRAWYFLDELAAPMYARAEGLRVITAEETAPISPDVEDKLIVVDLTGTLLTLSARENGKEVYYAVISSGGQDPKTKVWATTVGEHPISRKRIGVRMGGGDLLTGYDLVGVGWTCLFCEGEAIHSTYWHNDYGIPKSHGCVNARPEDAKWIFRWTTPIVPYPGGDVEKQMPGGTHVRVVA